MNKNWLADAYEKGDFVGVKNSLRTWIRLQSVGGLTLVATWVRDDLIEENQYKNTTKEQEGAES